MSKLQTVNKAVFASLAWRWRQKMDAEKTIGFLIDPEQSFKNVNIDLHGIDEAAVRDAPTF